MIKYEIRVIQEYDSWGSSGEYGCDVDYFHYEVMLFNNHMDNGTVLKVFGKGLDDLSDARTFAYDVYAVMDPTETKYVDQTR